MKTDNNIVFKYRFEIFVNRHWPLVSLLHCVLLEICHVTVVSYVGCISKVVLLGPSSVDIMGLPVSTPKPVVGLPNWNRLTYAEEMYDLVAMMLLTIRALSLLW